VVKIEVASSLLKTKLNIPPARPQMVPRPRLIERLKEGLGYNLVLVSAPAGFGKTTLLSEWGRLNRPQVRTGWISLDEGDNDPVRFWDYFITALQTIHSGFGEKILPWLHSSQPPSTEPLLTALINELSAAKDDFVIVLDDYHVIESPQIHDGITYMVERLPAHVHLTIATRGDPPLPLARFRGKGMMLEIRTDDLRFTLDDAASLLKGLKTPGLSNGDVAALNERTEGWVVGLKMAALSLKEQKDIPGFIADFTGSQRYVMDYLMEEVLRKQSPEVRDFLLKSSVLERLTAPSCEALTGRRDSQDILLNLERNHLFIVPLDETRQWYRYEHLFADLLRHQCEAVHGKERVAALHRQASQWFEDNNLPDEAIHHALEAKDWPRAMRLIDVHGNAHRKRGEFSALLGWLKTIPDELLRTHHQLYSQYTSLLAAVGQLDAAEAALSYLETIVQDDTALQGEAAFARGIVYRHRGDLKRCIELFEKAFTLAPPDAVAIRSRAAASIAHARQRYGPLQEAEKWATIARDLGRQAGDSLAVMMALGQLGIIAAYQGKLRRAVEIYKKVNELAGEMASWAGAQDMLSYTQYLINDLDAAAENAKLAVESGERSGQMNGVILALFCQAQVCLARGDVAGAEAAMEKMDQASRHPSVDSFWYSDYLTSRVMYAIRQGDLEEAARWGERLPDTNAIMPFDRHIPARLLLAQGKKEDAARYLRELYDSFVRYGANVFAIPIRIYQALAAENQEAALEFLAEALTMAAPEGVIRYFVDEGKLLKPLLEKALAQKITPEFTGKLLDIIEEEERQRRASKRAAAPPPPPGLLSEREREVLRLLSDDIPNERIAGKLNVSLGTVKTHVHHIIDKLEVKDRRQAVQRARELKLL
jgi:LuxR family maltose regulon positive regulatory protein